MEEKEKYENPNNVNHFNEVKFNGKVICVEASFYDVIFTDAEGKVHCFCEVLEPFMHQTIEISIRYAVK